MAKRGRIKYSGATYSRFRDRLDSEEDEIDFDVTKPLSDSILNSLKEVTAQSGKVRKSRRLAHLSALIKMWEAASTSSQADPSLLRLQEVMLCLRIPLCQDSVEVRAATLRTLRYLISTEEQVQDFISLNCHHLLARCLDIDLDNKVERVQALRLIRKLAFLGPRYFPLSLCRSLVAIAEGGKKECDRLHRICIACLCELSVLNSEVFIEANGVNALTFCLLDTSLPRVTEAIIACLLRLHNNPSTRNSARVELGVVVAPFTEFRYVHSGLLPTPGGPGSELSLAEEKNRRFQISEHAILSLMRSWPGILQLAQQKSYGGSHLQALVNILYLKNDEVRRRLVMLLFELLNLRVPKEPEVTINITNPSTFKDSWKLADGFVASEGMDILPHLAKSRPNLLENHKSFVLGCLLTTGLPEALVEVIISTDSDLSVLSIILLGELLHSASRLLPRELIATSHCLPALLAEISGTDPKRSNRASEAVETLERIHTIKKRGPVASSLFLEQILSSSGRFFGECFVGDRLQSPSWSSELKRSSEDQIRQNLKQSKVLDTTDAKVWEWEVVSAILRWPSESFHQLEVQPHKLFVRRVTDFFKPTNNLFSKIELDSPRAKYLAKAGCHLVDFLVSGKVPETDSILTDFLQDVLSCLDALSTSKSTHDCLFSPTRIASTATQYYFVFIGRLSYTYQGRKVLDKHSFLLSLANLLPLRSELYLKLIISSLDYTSPDWGSRNLLSKALKEGPETTRLYATKFLGVLIRNRTPNIAQWGIELLVGQLFDDSTSVPWVTLDLLDEACDDKMNLEAVVCALGTNLNLDHLGIRGAFLRNRLYTSSNSFNLLNRKDKDGKRILDVELEKWSLEWNASYVIVIEDLLNDGLTRHQRNDNRCYGRRSQETHSVRDIFVPSHLYGQLAMTQIGLENLMKDEELTSMLKYLRAIQESPQSSEWLKAKAAIWAVASIGLSPDGVLFIEREGAIAAIVNVAETSQVHSLRATAFYSLGLIATTRHGTSLLAKYGWCSLRYARNEQWPVPEDWFNKFQWLTQRSDYFEDDDVDVDGEGSSLKLSEGPPLSIDSPLEHFPSLSIDSSPKNSISISGRQRLSDLFRSFNLGSGSSPAVKQSNRRSSESGKTLTAKIKKNLFPRSRTQSHSSNTDKDDLASGPQVSSSASPLKTVLEVEKSAPIATPESSEGSNQSDFQYIRKDQNVIDIRTQICSSKEDEEEDEHFVEATFLPPPDVASSKSVKTVAVIEKPPPSYRDVVLEGSGNPDSQLEINSQPKTAIPSEGSNNFSSSKHSSLSDSDSSTKENKEFDQNQTIVCQDKKVLSKSRSLKDSNQATYSSEPKQISSKIKDADRSIHDQPKSYKNPVAKRFPPPRSQPTQEIVTHGEVAIVRDTMSQEELSLKGSVPNTSDAQSLDSPKLLNTSHHREEMSQTNLKSEIQAQNESKKSSSQVLQEPQGPRRIPQTTGKFVSSDEQIIKSNNNNTNVLSDTSSSSKNSKSVDKGPKDIISNGSKFKEIEIVESQTAKSNSKESSTSIVEEIDRDSNLISITDTFKTLSTLDSPSTGENSFNLATRKTIEIEIQPENGGTRILPKIKMTLDCSNVEPSNSKLSPIASSPIDSSFRARLDDTAEDKDQSQTQPSGRSRIHVRSGQRALSESEAQNMSGLSTMSNRKVYGNISANAAESRNTWSITSMSSIGSWTDNPGYLTFRSIYNRRRPPLSESESEAAGGGQLMNREGHQPDLLTGSRILRTDSWTRKSRSLDYRQTKLRHRQRPVDLGGNEGPSLPPNRSFSAPPARPPNLNFFGQEAFFNQGPEPQYWGITLPSNLSSLFPSTKQDLAEDEFAGLDSNASRDTEKRLEERERSGLELHTRDLCLACYRFLEENKQAIRQDITPDRIQMRKEVIKLISCMNATVGARTAEQGLLRYKQAHPEAFNDLCLYSEACLLLTRYSFRITSRRFIQELFMDLKYDELCQEPYKLLGISLDEPEVASAKERCLSNRSLTQVAESFTEDHFSSAASSPFS